MASSRLIIIPQYPAKLRYQEWFSRRLEEGYKKYFDVIHLIEPKVQKYAPQSGAFSTDMAVLYEIEQMKMYDELNLRYEDDTLLLCDISFPGLFSSILHHKRPERCFAICHGTSLNRYDYFASDRSSKRSVENGHAKLFDKVFVASEYHKNKLKWPNCHVVKFPLPNVSELSENKDLGYTKLLQFVSVARPSIQKVNKRLEREFVAKIGFQIHRPIGLDGRWDLYYQFLKSGYFLMVSSREETYGYQVIDALSVGTHPIAPRSCSYPELLPNTHLYKPGNVDSMIEIINSVHKEVPQLWEDTFIHDTAGIMTA